MKAPKGSYGAALPGYGTSLVDRINIYLHFRRYFKMLSERWLMVCILTALGAAGGVYIALSTPNKYESTSVLMIAPKLRTTGTGTEIMDDGTRFADTQIQLMLNPSLMNKVMARLAEGRDSSNKLVRPKLDAYPGRGSTFIMKVTATNYDYAQKFATAWAQEFMDFKKQQRATLVNSSAAATARDILTYDQKLERARLAIEDFRKRYSFAGNTEPQMAQANYDTAKTEYETLRMQRQLLEKANSEDIARDGFQGVPGVPGVASTKRTMPSDRTSSGNSSGADSKRGDSKRGGDSKSDDGIEGVQKFEARDLYMTARTRIGEIEDELEKRSKVLRDAHPYMVNLREELEDRRRDMRKALALVEEMRKARVEYLRDREDHYKEVVERYKEEANEANKLMQEFTHLREEEQIIKDNLDALRKKQSEFDRVGADEDQFSQIELGGGTPEPTGPNRPLIVGSGVLIGLLLGIGGMYLLHRLDDRLDQPEKIEAALEEPVMGQLPEVDKKHFKEGYLLLNRMKSHTMFAESLRGVRSALLLSPEGSSKRLLAVTSAVPGDGKTTFTTNFAITLANAGNKTLLIDADLRRGNIHGYFEQPVEGGLAEVLQGRMTMKEAIRETGISNLSFMRAGERPHNPSELLLSPQTKDFIRELRSEFDYVVFDCPPLTAIDDTFSIAAYLDGLFFVIRAGQTSMRFAKLAVNTIRQRGAPILGLIVNGVPIDNPYYYYTTYYYASYYHRPITPDGEPEPPSGDKQLGSGTGRAEPVEAGRDLEAKRDRETPVATAPSRPKGSNGHTPG